MTPQMIRTLTYFMLVVFFKEGFDFADWKIAKKTSSLVMMAIVLRFLFLVYRQWSYLG